MTVAQKIYDETLAQGGVSMDSLGNVPVAGFMVSELGGVEVALDEFSVQDIEHAIAENKGGYIGTWIDEKTVYIDYSVNFTELGKALDFGRRNGQRTIYLLNTQKVIYL